MNFIKIQNTRINLACVEMYNAVYDPSNEFRSVIIIYPGKKLTFDFDTAEDAHSVMDKIDAFIFECKGSVM